MDIKLIKGMVYDRVAYKDGDTLAVSSSVGERLIAQGRAVEAPKAEEKPKPKPIRRKSNATRS